MPLAGRAFVVLWHDIATEGDADYNLWHTRQHMPERVALPGFIRSRRGVNRALDRQHYFTLYEGEALEAFVSDAYMKSLNFPTEWTTRVAPHFRNFLRMACATAHSQGDGVGGAIASFRCDLPEGMDEAAALAALAGPLNRIADLPEVSAVHVGLSRPVFSEVRTRETELRPAMAELAFQLIVLVEGIGLSEMLGAEKAITAEIAGAGFTNIVPQSYDMAYMLESDAA